MKNNEFTVVVLLYFRELNFPEINKSWYNFSPQFLEDIFEKMFLTSSKHRTNSLKIIDNSKLLF